MAKKEDYKLTAKEQTAIDALKELAKVWPKSLSLGEDTDSDNIAVWKKGRPRDLWSSIEVAVVKIRNHDSW
jgi:hypothetical protein